ncbi:MAG: PaaI family thioesterase [Methanosarcinales archaeon]|nr:PaaI family thioesterase [Methanosarcinales archaeon]
MPLDQKVMESIRSKSDDQPFARRLGLKLVGLDEGYSRVEMEETDELDNLFGTVHGGAIFALMDQAFGAAANSHGTVAVALSVNINYLRPAMPGEALYAEAREVSRTRSICTYNIEVRDRKERLIATCQAMAFRKQEPLPFL